MFDPKNIIKYLMALSFGVIVIYFVYIYKDRQVLIKEKEAALLRSSVIEKRGKENAQQAAELIKSSEQQANNMLEQPVSKDCEKANAWLIDYAQSH